MEITAGFILGLFAVLVVLIVVVNPFITGLAVAYLQNPNVWDGAFEISLDDGRTILGSFQKGYGIEGIDIPKGRRIKGLIIKRVPRGFVPMVLTTDKVETRFITSLCDFPEDDRLVDLYFEVMCPETPPTLFSFTVASNQRIANGEERRGIFFTKRSINIWFFRPGAE